MIRVAHSRYTGPGFLLSEIEGELPMFLLFCHTPVEDGKVRAWHRVMMRAKGDSVTAEDQAVFDMMLATSHDSFAHDLHISGAKSPPCVPGKFPVTHRSAATANGMHSSMRRAVKQPSCGARRTA